jgi:outer membrane protein OmpA-like peptidoglycan-associated protein
MRAACDSLEASGRERPVQHPKRWWIGLPILAALTYLAADALTRDVERDLSRRAGAAVGTRGIEHPQISVSGRDVTVSGEAVSPQALSAALAALRESRGVRVAIDASTPPRQAAIAPGPSAPSAPKPARLADLADLQRAIDARLEKAPIAFAPDKDELLSGDGSTLDEVAALLRRSERATLEIVGRAPEASPRRILAERRAQAVAARLIALGVASGRVAYAGVAPENEDPSRPAIEIKVQSF